MFTNAQVPQSLRALNYVPNECYSLSVLHLDSMAKNFELQALDKDHVLNAFYKKSKFVKTLMKSWINKDDKLGVDFTAAMAYCDANIIMLPLNNEAKFEKMLNSLAKQKIPFESMKIGGKAVRYCAYEETGLSVHLFCTSDMAFAFLYVENYNVEVLPVKDMAKQRCDELFQSGFLQSPEGKYFVENHMSSYVYYSPESPNTKQFFNVAAKLGVSDYKDALRQMNIKTFTRGEVRKNTMTSVMEIFEGEEQMAPILIEEDRLNSKQLEKLLPYAGPAPLAIMTCNVQGIGDMMSPVMSAFPSFQPMASFVNNSFLVRYNADNVLFVTMLDESQAVLGSLELYVQESNRIKDSTYHAAKEMYEKYLSQSEDEEFMESEELKEINYYALMGMMYAAASGDSLSGRKSLLHEEKDGWNVYTILTSRLDYEDKEVYVESEEEADEALEEALELEPIIVYDTTAYVLVHDGFLFCTNTSEAFKDIRKPSGKPQTLPVEEMLNRPVYASADVATLASLSGIRIDVPISDLVIYLEGNTVVTNLNAVRGLKHGMFYEMVKIVADLVNE